VSVEATLTGCSLFGKGQLIHLFGKNLCASKFVHAVEVGVDGEELFLDAEVVVLLEDVFVVGVEEGIVVLLFVEETKGFAVELLDVVAPTEGVPITLLRFAANVVVVVVVEVVVAVAAVIVEGVGFTTVVIDEIDVRAINFGELTFEFVCDICGEFVCELFLLFELEFDKILPPNLLANALTFVTFCEVAVFDVVLV
jgi:hypothetical protein